MKHHKKHISKSKLLLIVACVVILLVGGFSLLYEETSIFKSKSANEDTTLNSYTKGVTSTSSSGKSSKSSSGSSSKGSSSSSTSTSSSGQPPLQPTGDFVSDHHPDLSGSPAPNTLTSVCNTTPGAYCQISFTMNGVTKSLASEQTNSGGAAYWVNWSLQSVGLTMGSWKTTATATLNGQTTSATDAMDLVVSQ